MFKKILVDFDSVHLSVVSVKQALDLAQLVNASVVLLVIRPQLDSLMVDTDEAFIDMVTEQIAIEHNEIENYANKLLVPLSLAIMNSGHAVNALLEFSRENQFDLLVVGKQHTNHSFKDVILGATWKQVMSQATLPVLMFP